MTEISIPKISAEKISELSYIKPVKIEQGVLFYLAHCDPVDSSFPWMKTTKRARGLVEIARTETLHKYGYHGFFKPSVSEVYAQITKSVSKELLKRAVAFQTIGPNTVDDINKSPKEFNSGFHVAETILYEQGDVSQKNMSMRHFESLSVEEKLDNIHGLFETPGSMKDDMRRMYFKNPGSKKEYWECDSIKSWDCGTGNFITVGHYGDMPIAICIWWDKINDKFFGFYNTTSVLVHHDMIAEWLSKRYNGKIYDDDNGFLLPTLVKKIEEDEKNIRMK